MNQNGSEVMVMPYFTEPMVINADSTFSLLDMMHTKPRIVLLFFNRSHFKHATYNHANLDYRKYIKIE